MNITQPQKLGRCRISPMRLLLPLLFLWLASARVQDHLIPLLKELTEAPGPPGYEEPVRRVMVEHMRPYADKISYDGLRSAIAQQAAPGRAS